MRLIDADAMLKRLEEWNTDDRIDKALYNFTFNRIMEQPTIEERKWIPCSERLPEDDVEVFVYLFERQSPYIAWVEDCRWYTEDFEVERENYPTAWMPLPEPYEEGAK